MTQVDVLLPTCNRLPSLAMTLAGLAGQTYHDYALILADQSDQPVTDAPVIRSILRILEEQCDHVEYHHRPLSHGIAEQRHFLLQAASAPYVLYLDDDVWLEPWVLQELVSVLDEQDCAFVGAFPTGLSFREDIRPDQQAIEYWDGPVLPEVIWPDTAAWERWQLHRAANLYHISRQIPKGEHRLYKVAWVASCILYRRESLIDVGGFSFWERLPRYHSGEEVLVQNLLMRRWGGCAVIPSGAYSSEMPSTVLNEKGTVEGHALSLLPEMVQRFVPGGDGHDPGHQNQGIEINPSDPVVLKGEPKR